MLDQGKWFVHHPVHGCLKTAGTCVFQAGDYIKGWRCLETKLDRRDANGMDGLIAALRSYVSGGAKLPAERDLSRQLGVNRHTLRLGLQFLRDAGELKPAKARASSSKSFKKLSISKNTSPVDVWEARLSMEPQIARAAALRATPNEIEAIREAHLKASPNAFDPATDNDFHNKVAIASHNNLWIILTDLMTGLTLEESFQMQLPPFTKVTGYDHHQEIFEAIAARDAAAAEKAMYAHLLAIQRWVMGLPASD
jgi:GntR family transcriptional repressor for pyruvate dehydrogenase complex